MGTILDGNQVAVATTSAPGVVKPDGVAVLVDGTGKIWVPLATATVPGLMFPDGTTCTVDLTTGKLTVTGGGTFTRVPHDETASRSFGTIYQNTSGKEMWVSGWGQTSPGSATGDMVVLVDSVTPPVLQVWGNESTATVSGGKAGFGFLVPNNYYYQITSTGAIPNEAKWIEYY